MSAAQIGYRVRSRRHQLGLSQREVSAPGVSPQYLSRIEQGARAPSVKALRKIAARLEVTPEWLETGSAGLALTLTLAEAVALREVLETSGFQQLAERLARLIERTPA